MVETGKKANDFCVASANKEQICLKDLSGKWVVLFFYRSFRGAKFGSGGGNG